ncbi:ABC transporter substrate-binding protein [Mollicutes bacterium LVI A0078]|nr:ABC transporter substrate-binding protein [Mollicutes bacterium LVI A0075]WOO91565.1 ABC transporter substrate-binding protein [Mollicutes bacterium LVI A0078]
MKKLLSTVIVGLLILSGCQSQAVNTVALEFTKSGDDYSLNTTEEMTTYNQLITDLTNLQVDLNADTPVAVLATSTANILDSIGLNIIAVTDSKDLNQNLTDKLANGEITNLGSALEPNLELLYQVEPDVVFVGSNMPHTDQYDFLDNLVVLPQENYPEIFYTVYGLMEQFSLGDQAQAVFNQLVTTDQEAKSLISDQDLGDVAILKYAYGNVTIAPDNTYAGSLLTELSIDNMYGDLKDVDLPMDRERLLTDDPDMIIVYGKGEEAVSEINDLIASSKLDSLTAAQKNQIYVLESQSLNVDVDSPATLLELSKDVYGQ